MTLEEDTEVQYKVSAPYAPAHDRAIRFDDPAIGIEWPDASRPASPCRTRTATAPLLAEIEPEL